jgi:hypothetical protein
VDRKQSGHKAMFRECKVKSRNLKFWRD